MMKTFRQYLKESFDYKVYDIDEKRELGKYPNITQAIKNCPKKYKNFVVYDKDSKTGYENANTFEMNHVIKALENEGHTNISVTIEVSEYRFF